MTNTERIEELKETVEELQDTIKVLEEYNTDLQETVDELREEVEQHVENFARATKQMNEVSDRIKRFIDVSYRFDQQGDILQVQARITREVLEHAGPEELDMTYQNMKDQLTEAMKKPYNYPNIPRQSTIW